MDYCNYHPMEPATYHCPQCQIDCCDLCVDDSDIEHGIRCLKCHGEMTLLAAEHRVTPFWRRLQESFRYPLNLQTLLLIAAVSVVSTLTSMAASAQLVAFIINLAATGVMVKYSFLSLQETSAGNLEAPDLTEAYQGGIALVLRLMLMLFLMGASVFAVAVFVHPSLAGLLGFYFIVAFPASLIQFAISENTFAALNPLNSFRLIAAIGLPYGLLVALILVMVGSVSVIHQLIGYEFSVVALSLQAMASNYYIVVVFHIMGYMLFQYQGRLGYSAREHGDVAGRSEEAVTLANLDMLLKEGRYDALREGYNKALERFPSSKALYGRYFDFLVQAKNPDWLGAFAERYLRFLLQQGHSELLGQTYRTTRTVLPKFLPNSPELRLALAKDCHKRDDARGVVSLINGMQRQYPDFPHLPAALELLADSLQLLPNLAEKAEACRALAERVRQAQQSRAAEPKRNEPPSRVRPMPIEPEPVKADSADGIGPPKTLELIEFTDSGTK